MSLVRWTKRKKSRSFPLLGLRWVSLERGILEETVEIAEVLIGGVDVLILVAAISGEVFDRFDFLLFESAGGILGVIEIVAEEVEGFDGAVEGGTKLFDEVVDLGFVKQVGVVA